MSKPVLLFAPETFNIAETTRMVEIAKASASAFEPHFMGYGGSFVQVITEAGFPFHLLEPRYTPEKIDYLWKIDRMEQWGDPFTLAEVRRRVTSELKLYEQIQPAAIVIGFTMTVYVSARAAKIPLAAVTPFAFTRPFFQAALGTFPDQFRVGLLNVVPDALLDRLLTVWALRTRAWTKSFNQVMKSYGLAPFDTLMELWEGDIMLIADIPEVTGVFTLPDHWHYVGPIFAHLPGNIPPEVAVFAERRPSIYCAMGSSGHQSVVKTVIENFEGLPYAVIAPVKSHLDHTGVKIPSNVLVTEWLPALEVNRLVDIAVIHGGHGTVQTACAAGKPFIGIGMQPEQEWNIDFLVRQKCARRLSRRNISHDELSAAIRDLLANEEALAAVKRIQRLYQQTDGARNTARLLVQTFGSATNSE